MVFRRRSSTPPDPLAAIDPARLPPAYRAPVVDAVRARTQFGELVAGLHEGPLRTRLQELAGRVDSGVLAVWHTATRAAEIDRVSATLDVERVTAELKQARRSGAADEVVAALQERFASMQRLLNGRDAQRERLPVLEARLATAVARAAELVLTSPASVSTEIDALTGDLDRLVVELEALDAATTELG
ncbi:MAG: hypothetical protein ABW195_01100 [Ilumatobacteraceae bacterium]